MKKINLFLTMVLILNQSLSLAQVAVQKTPSSSYSEFQDYLKKSGSIPFSQAYIQVSAATELNTPLLEQCLEEVYLGAPFEDTCFEAVKSLSSRPLNKSRRDVLSSFLKKLSKVSKKNKNFYQSYLDGFQVSHPLHSNEESLEPKKENPSLELEMNAWRKAIGQKVEIGGVSLLINGKKISRLESWKAPAGVFQWSLVTDSFEPITRISTFSQFASTSLKELKALTVNGCEDIKKMDPKKFGVLRLEVFESKKCIVQFHQLWQPEKDSGHLGASRNVVNLEAESKRQWTWAAMLLLGAGAAFALKDKNVQFKSPSFSNF